MSWKTVAIIFIVLFLVETIFIGWSIFYYNKEQENQNICWYDICGAYPDAIYENNICTCYDYDIFDNLVVAKTKYMK